MKIIAYYLPQFHEIPENNELWGKGFTEWTNVKNARPFFDWHEQPVSPLNNNYYNLLDESVMLWQANLAKQYGIYGFCFYHYWYNGHKLLEKPLDAFLKNKSIDIHFCICWANHDWTTSWANKESKTIFKQDYKDKKDWLNHFNYLLPFFNDSRYMKENGKPIVVIYEAACDRRINKMLDYWQKLAKENSLPGLVFAYQSFVADSIYGFSTKRFKYDIEYQPQYFRELQLKKSKSLIHSLSFYAKRLLPNWIAQKKKAKKISSIKEPTVVDYSLAWERILEAKPTKPNAIPGAFVRMDTTPRIKERGFITKGMTVDLFKKYLTQLIEKAKTEYKTDYIFIFAWNEWAEGGYLEPDSKNKYGVLEAIREALKESGEL